MDTPSALLVALIGAVTVGEAATADFVNVIAEEFRGDGWVEHGYEGLTTYRVYAVFDWTSDDGVLSVFAIPESPVIRVASSDGRFHNDKLFDSHTPPQDRRPFGYWSNQWDTYVTVWTDTEGDCCEIRLSPDFVDQANGLQTTFVVEDGSWYRNPGCCDFGTCCFDPRILIGQFVVAEGVRVAGTVNLLTRAEQIEGADFLGVPDSACLGDVDDSGRVDVGDVLAILTAWGSCQLCPEDIDVSGVVDVGDLLIALSQWGPCSR